MKIVLSIIAFVAVVVALLLVALCLNSGRISRGEERKELEDWIREQQK